jgi:hypothetical protein
VKLSNVKAFKLLLVVSTTVAVPLLSFGFEDFLWLSCPVSIELSEFAECSVLLDNCT